MSNPAVRAEPRRQDRSWMRADDTRFLLTLPRQAPAAVEPLEESLIVDSRADLRPAQAVEQKLVSLLEGKALSVSQLRLASLSARNRAAGE